MGVPAINTSTWFGGGTASTAVLTPAQVAAVAPLVRVTAAYIVMYYSFCFFQSWSKLYLSASRRPSLFFPARRRRPLAARSSELTTSEPRAHGRSTAEPTAYGSAHGRADRAHLHAIDEIRHRRDTPSTRYAIDATPPTPYAIDAINVINKTQATAATARSRRSRSRRQEADARAAEIWRLRLVQDADAAVAR